VNRVERAQNVQPGGGPAEVQLIGEHEKEVMCRSSIGIPLESMIYAYRACQDRCARLTEHDPQRYIPGIVPGSSSRWEVP